MASRRGVRLTPRVSLLPTEYEWRYGRVRADAGGIPAGQARVVQTVPKLSRLRSLWYASYDAQA